jgi:hypothetical protein
VIITKDSHLDHDMTLGLVSYLLQTFGERDGFFIDNLVIPREFDPVACGLHGPIVGDAPIPEDECSHQVRGNRKYTSRICERPSRTTRAMTVIAGPHGKHSCILYTVFGGPLAPKEPGDPSLEDKNREESIRFWKEHALSR